MYNENLVLRVQLNNLREIAALSDLAFTVLTTFKKHEFLWISAVCLSYSSLVTRLWIFMQICNFSNIINNIEARWRIVLPGEYYWIFYINPNTFRYFIQFSILCAFCVISRFRIFHKRVKIRSPPIYDVKWNSKIFRIIRVIYSRELSTSVGILSRACVIIHRATDNILFFRRETAFRFSRSLCQRQGLGSATMWSE